MSMYDVLIIGAGPGGIFTAYELIERRPDLKIAIFEHGHELSRRKCPIDGEKIKSCIHCNCCSIMSGFVRIHPSLRDGGMKPLETPCIRVKWHKKS